jgi:eukaryotic-like serine/threonine-protein kinase
MTPERWARIKDVFADALDLGAAERAAFLDSACGGDLDLRREVDRLLAQAGATLKSPAGQILTQAPLVNAGEMLAHYRVEGKLGQGGMGSVYRAYDTRLERPVALKVLPPNQFAGPEQKERLIGEARAASALNHPNIVTVYEIGAGQGVDFIAMEFVDGRSLAQLIPPNGLPLQRGLEWAIEIAGALAQAHSAGVIHRDLKPANVMVNRSGHIKLLDFGLAQRVHFTEEESALTTAQGEISGTPAYMSPEQAEGLKADHRSDIFSFGAMLYEMLSGRQPFAGSSATSVMASVLRDEPQPLVTIPFELVKLVGRCMRKDPSRRFQHMGDIRILLEDFVQELIPPKPPAPQAVTAAPQRHGRPVWANAAIAIAVMLFASFAIWKFRPAAPAHVTAGAPEVAGTPASGSATSPPADLPASHTPGTPPDSAGAQPTDDKPLRESGAPPNYGGALHVVPLTTYPGMVRDPSFSPDGKQVAFAWNGADRPNSSIYVRVVDSAAPPLRLTTGNANDVAATWSPHGTAVAFRRTSGAPGIYMVPPLGGVEKKIADATPLGQETLAQMSWTPDGNWLAAPERSPSGATEIFLYPLHEGEKHQLTRNSSGIDQVPAISPNGRFLAFASCTYMYPCDVYVVPLDSKHFPLSGQATRITHQGSYIRGLSWERDGKHVVYAAGMETNMETQLWRVAVSPPGFPERIEVAGSQVRHPAVAPEGNHLAFTRFNRDADIWQYSIDGKPKPFISSTVFEFDPAFSPDGKRIAYCSRVSGLVEIWACDRDGSKPLQLTDQLGRGNSSPAWSPDGRTLAFDSQGSDGHTSIYVIPAAGGAPHRITPAGYDAYAPSWSRDGKWIYFGRTGEPILDIWRIPLSGGECVRVTDHGGFNASESFDGKQVYYTKEISTSLDGYRTPVYVKSLSGGAEREVVRNVEWYGFSVAPDGIYYIGNSSGSGYPLKFFDFAAADSRTLTMVPAVPFQRLTVSPDRQTFLFSTLRSLNWELALIQNYR